MLVLNKIRQFYYSLQRLIGRSEFLFEVIYALLGSSKKLMVSGDTDIVMEGFPRSSNTFSVVAFEFAQGRPIKAAHHLHVPAQILMACRMNIPAVILIREPVGAVASLVIREPHISIRAALKEYIAFYETVLPVVHKCVIARFEDITTDFGKVIEDINNKYATNFSGFEHTEENVEKVFELVQHYAALESTKGEVDEAKVGRPSQCRKEIAQKITQNILSTKFSGLRTRADTVYTAVCTGEVGLEANDS